MLRNLAANALRRGQQCREITSSAAALGSSGRKVIKKTGDIDSYELLPPGCSIADPSYGHSMSDPVVIYDQQSVEDYKPVQRLRKNVAPQTPTSRAAAQAKLDAKKAAAADPDEPYVYLPPGSSMRDPGYNSMSDPSYSGHRVYYRDPIPTLRKK